MSDRRPATFDELLDVMRDLHHKKDADYAGGVPYANMLGSTDLGIPPYLGAALRMRDKLQRVCVLLKREFEGGGGPNVADETVEDTLVDLASYALIVYVLRERARAG